MKGHFLAAAAVTAAAMGAALLSGSARHPALLGAAMASGTGLASLYGLNHSVRWRRRALQGALLVFVVMFLVRILLVGVGVAVVARAGESAVAFVVAFFAPYFAFTAIEGSLVHALNRGMGKPA
ncbi:MAG TPA: hypothetical protein VLV17_01825 [Anaeromyxobacteraceae bacterium]|nr:hypothetical protein [Anaeromyxobacteraceae bacterium]